MTAPESEAKEIMFEKRLLSLKCQTNIHKAKEGPKERTTINEIYLIFQMLFLDSNKIEFSTYQFIFSIKKEPHNLTSPLKFRYQSLIFQYDLQHFSSNSSKTKLSELCSYSFYRSFISAKDKNDTQMKNSITPPDLRKSNL